MICVTKVKKRTNLSKVRFKWWWIHEIIQVDEKK